MPKDIIVDDSHFCHFLHFCGTEKEYLWFPWFPCDLKNIICVPPISFISFISAGLWKWQEPVSWQHTESENYATDNATNKEYLRGYRTLEGANLEGQCTYDRWHEGMAKAFRLQRYHQWRCNQFYPAWLRDEQDFLWYDVQYGYDSKASSSTVGSNKRRYRARHSYGIVSLS